MQQQQQQEQEQEQEDRPMQPAARARPPIAPSRASPGHLVVCGHACLYGAIDATRSAPRARTPRPNVLARTCLAW